MLERDDKVTIDGAMKATGKSRATIYRLVAAHDLDSWSKRGRTLVSLSQIWGAIGDTPPPGGNRRHAGDIQT